MNGEQDALRGPQTLRSIEYAEILDSPGVPCNITYRFQSPL
jgi:hypothetical protein